VADSDLLSQIDGQSDDLYHLKKVDYGKDE
jgi:hypothetical protein